jgi:glycosyltransferase involved in cell wall biosynthesis
LSAADSDPVLLAPSQSAPLPPSRRPSFSVVVAAWQAESTVGEAIRSALTQTEPPAEVIVCDDGSTDATADVLAGFGDRIQVFRQPNRGESAAKNAAVRAASGDFVVILDADDRWDPRRLRRLGDLAAARPDLDLLTTDAWFLVDGERRGRFYAAAGAFPVREQSTEILRRNFFFSHVAARRTAWLASGGFDPAVAWAADWDFWLRLLFAGHLAGCVAEPLADYRIHTASLSADRASSLLARVQVLDRAAATQRLAPGQREVLSRARADYLRRARVARAERALLDGLPGRRRACLELLVAPGGSTRGRVLAAAAALAPGLAGSRLRRGRERGGRARSDRAISAPDATA